MLCTRKYRTAIIAVFSIRIQSQLIFELYVRAYKPSTYTVSIQYVPYIGLYARDNRLKINSYISSSQFGGTEPASLHSPTRQILLFPLSFSLYTKFPGLTSVDSAVRSSCEIPCFSLSS
jgi:hypothetical protein